MCCAWPVGLVAWFSLRVREVPGSTPGQAQLLCFISLFVCLFVCFKIKLFLLFFTPSRETLETKLALLKVSFVMQSKYVTSEILVQLRSPKASSVNAYNWEHATLLISFDDVHLFPRYLFRSLILHRVMAWEIGSVLRGYQAFVCNSRHDKSVCFPGINAENVFI